MKIRNLTLTALFAAVTAVCAQIAIPLPFSAVPFSMAMFAIFLCGAMLPKWYALAAQVVYVLLGAIGLPIYAHFTSGLSILVGPTGGYLVAYPIMAFLIAWGCELFPKRPFPAMIVSMAIATVVCYLLGSVWLSVQSGISLWAAILSGAAPFALFDGIKIVLAASVALVLRRALKKAKLAS